MELINRAHDIVKAGRRNDRFNEYAAVYYAISGKTYKTKCTACSCKYLYRYIQYWYEDNK